MNPEDPKRSAETGFGRSGHDDPALGDPLAGLREARCIALERAPIRTRESLVTRSAWLLRATSTDGEGTISLIELSPTVSLYRGEGVFLGWSSDRLEAAYRTLIPRAEEDSSESDFPQLG